MRIAIVGATGLVGSKMLSILAERNFPITALYLVASNNSIGKEIKFRDSIYKVIGMEEAVALKPDIALFSAGGDVSKKWAPAFAEQGTRVIDNSSAWRMEAQIPLIVPEVNASTLSSTDYIIANPNCSTIQMVLALAPIHKTYGIKRIVVSTYQSVTGTGVHAVNQLMEERQGNIPLQMAYPYPIDLNVIPQIDVFLENNYTKEEMKMVNETRKILNDEEIGISATAVRIPVMGGHSESVNVETKQPFTIEEIRNLWKNTPGIQLKDDIQQLHYPMPIDAHENDAVWVGRLRLDHSQKNTFNAWIVSDNLRKGAATNAIQIAEYLILQQIVKPT
jgi:aspartate-semialdehyde dehydrogenase